MVTRESPRGLSALIWGMSQLFRESVDDTEKQVSFQHLWLERTRLERHWANDDKANICSPKY